MQDHPTVLAGAGPVFVPYLVWGLLIVAFMVLKTICLRKTHRLHVHHYTVGMIFIALIGYQSIVAGITQGFCNGMMIEGGGRWGYDDIWIKEKKDEKKTEAEATKVEKVKPEEESEHKPVPDNEA